MTEGPITRKESHQIKTLKINLFGGPVKASPDLKENRKGRLMGTKKKNGKSEETQKWGGKLFPEKKPRKDHSAKEHFHA